MVAVFLSDITGKLKFRKKKIEIRYRMGATMKVKQVSLTENN
jgi:hypothetical protein